MTNEERDRLLVELSVKQDTILDRLNTFITREEFAPVKAVVYGSVRVVLAAVITGVLGLAAWAKADVLSQWVK